MNQKPEISVVIPVCERKDDLQELHAAYSAALQTTGRAIEFIYVVDGPQTDVLNALTGIADQQAAVNVVELRRNFGESNALMAGFERSQGEILVTLPAYFQVEADELPRMIDELAATDLVIGHRFPRAGSKIEKLRRALFHRSIQWVTGSRFNDLGCGVRVLRREIVDELTLYGDQHRFLPLLVDRLGFSVTELEVRQSPKDFFSGRYRFREYVHRALDLLTVFFLIRFTKKPLRFFGMIGTAMFALGAIYLFYVVGERLFGGVPLADRPALLLSSLLVVLGIQITSFGLIGEIIIFTHAKDQKEYRIRHITE